MGDKPNLCRDMEDAMRVIRRILAPETKNVVYDVETNGLSFRTNFICGHVVTFGPAPSDTYYVPVRHGEGNTGNICEPKAGAHPFEVHLHKAAQRRDLHWVGHHFMFDLMFMWAHGIEPAGSFEDTEINAALLDEYSRSYSLANCCTVMGTPAKKGDALYAYLASLYGGPVDKKQMANFWKLDGQNAMGFDYAAGDGVATWSLWQAQLKALEAQDLLGIHKVESNLTRVLYRMKKRGVRIDQDELRRVADHTKHMIQEGLKLLPPGFEFGRPSEMRKLMEKHNHTDWPMTAPSKKFPHGQPSFQKEWLKTHEIGRAVVNVREWDHLKTSFIQPLQERHLVGGRVHCTYYQMANDDFGTCTGRLSCSEPNLQQVPKRNKAIAKIFRRIFVPDIGMDWWDSDLSQCLAAGTQVSVPGGTKNIENIQPGDLVYSYDDGLNLVLRRVSWAGQTGVRELHRLHWITNGRTSGHLDATACHPIRMINGEYKTVGALIIESVPGRKHPCGQSTLALRRAVQVIRGKERQNYLFTNGRTRFKESRFVFEQVHGYAPKHVHHIDGDSLNDSVINLEGIDRHTHLSEHSIAMAMAKIREERVALFTKASYAARDMRQNNHIISRIETLSGLHPVYDITVEDTHNFIANEICVHNCEPRLLAHYSGAKVLVSGYLADPPVDAHQAVTDAVLALGVQIDREEGKRLNQTLITGGGKGKIVTMLGARGEEIYDGYFNAMPEVKNFQVSAKNRFRQRGYIISLLGRRSRLEHPSKDYLAMNRVLQCSNADVIKSAMVKIDNLFEEDGDECALLNNVHDAISMQGEPHKEPVLLEALRLFTDFGPGRTVPMRVPLQADYGVGANWADATFPAVKRIVG